MNLIFYIFRALTFKNFSQGSFKYLIKVIRVFVFKFVLKINYILFLEYFNINKEGINPFRLKNFIGVKRYNEIENLNRIRNFSSSLILINIR